MVQPIPSSLVCPSRARGRCVRGVTLIEMMIAVAIVGILASIAVPSYYSWRDRARSRQAGQEMAAMAALIDRYAADNGGTFPDDLSVVGLNARTDPWGHAYEYTNLSATGATSRRRQDKNINPINSDYDLFSRGPNNDWQKQLDNAKSVDDIVRGRSGRFFGLASDF